MANYYDELLKLCGFEEEEINSERPRIEKVFQKLELGAEDMKVAESWVRQNHDVELMGVRKVLRIWLKELIDLVLSREEGKKLVYYGFPSIAGPAMAISAASDELYCTCPDVVLCHTMGQIFNKLGPILEAGEENGLPPGYGLCSLQQIRVGSLAKGIVPVPDLALTSSYYCDMGSKTDELLHQRYGHPAVYVDGSMDSRWGEFPDYTPERVEFLGRQIDRLLDGVKEILGVEVTQEAWNEGMSRSRQLFAAVGELAGLMRTDPQPISAAEVGIARYMLTGAQSRRVMEDGPSAVAILTQETKEKVDKGIGVVEKGAPRIMLFSTTFSDPSVIRMIEDAGLAIPVLLMTAPLRMQPWQTTYTTLGEKQAEVEMKVGIYHSSYAMSKRWAEVVEDLKLDGTIWNYHFGCTPLRQPSHLLPKFAGETAGAPVLSLETDYYDSRSYSAEALRTRVETFAEMLRTRKMAKVGG